MNDWPIKQFLLLVFYFQLVWLLLVGLDVLDFHLPLLRPLFSFIVLSFLPGYLFLRILRLHQLGSATSLLYATGLSIASLMFIGLFLSVISPLFGISTPISLVPLTVTFNLFILFLALLAYLRDRDFQAPEFLHLEELTSPVLLFLFLLPIMAILGTYLLNLYGNNTLQMLLLLVLAIFPLLTLKWVEGKFYPLVIFVLSLSVLLHTSLVSSYVWGPDLNAELIVANFVVKTSLWNFSIFGDYNAMLSVVLLAPIYSILSQLSLVWIFKIIYPVLFSLVPVGLYVVYHKFTGQQRVAFVACIFFITINAFFNTLAATARQEIAEIFLVLILMMVLEDRIKNSQTYLLLLLIFGFSLVVSHYGVTWIFLLIIGLSIPILLILNYLPARFRIKHQGFKNFRIVNLVFPLFLLFIALTWYILVTDSSIFINISSMVISIITSITDIITQDTSQGLYYLQSNLPYFQSLERYMYLLCDVLITVGILRLIWDHDLKLNSEYKALSMASFLVLVLGIVMPYFSAALNIDRLFHINLFFLAVFFVTGFLYSIKGLNWLLKKISGSRTWSLSVKNSFYLIALFLMVFSLFNTAFIYQVFDQPKLGRFALDNGQDFYVVNNQEIGAMEWYKENSDPQLKIYADSYKSVSLENMVYLNSTPPDFVFLTTAYSSTDSQVIEATAVQIEDPNSIYGNSYFFLGTYDLKNKKLLARGDNDVLYVPYQEFTSQLIKLYDNGGSWILKGIGD